MGCDIHMFAEIKRNGIWEPSGKIFDNPYHRPTEENIIDEDGYEWNGKFQESPYSGRNYDLFAILADVRNGYAFAGIKTGEGFNPIASPKGLPEDVTKYVLSKSDYWDCDGHSHSYFTVQELLDYDWHQITFKEGYISFDKFKEFNVNGNRPNSWSGMISGPNIVLIDEFEAEKYIESGFENTQYDGKDMYVKYRWSITYQDHCENFIKETIPKLKTLGEPDDVRIVFWFDN